VRYWQHAINPAGTNENRTEHGAMP
jgi:hypothetical protein